MGTVEEVFAQAQESLRLLRLGEKRLRAAALCYAAGEYDLADLQSAALVYDAHVNRYRQLERILLSAGMSIPLHWREGPGELLESCAVRNGETLQ